MNAPLSADRVRALLGTSKHQETPAKARKPQKRYYVPTGKRPGLPKGGKKGKLLTWLIANKQGVTFGAYDIPVEAARNLRSASTTLAFLHRNWVLERVSKSVNKTTRTTYRLR